MPPLLQAVQPQLGQQPCGGGAVAVRWRRGGGAVSHSRGRPAALHSPTLSGMRRPDTETHSRTGKLRGHRRVGPPRGVPKGVPKGGPQRVSQRGVPKGCPHPIPNVNIPYPTSPPHTHCPHPIFNDPTPYPTSPPRTQCHHPTPTVPPHPYYHHPIPTVPTPHALPPPTRSPRRTAAVSVPYPQIRVEVVALRRHSRCHRHLPPPHRPLSVQQ